MGTQAKRYIQPAGLVPWPDLFNNLRSSRETELFTHFPIHDACAWIGNSHKVALEYYVQTRDEYFSQAANYRTESDVKSDVICDSIAPITTEMHQSAS